MKKYILPVSKKDKTVIINALIDFRNALIKQQIYTDSVDELIIKINK